MLPTNTESENFPPLSADEVRKICAEYSRGAADYAQQLESSPPTDETLSMAYRMGWQAMKQAKVRMKAEK